MSDTMQSPKSTGLCRRDSNTSLDTVLLILDFLLGTNNGYT